MEEVKVYGVDLSPFSLRVELGLKLKGVEYEFIKEDPMNKSERLLKNNPIYKKVPVFSHQGRVLVESLVILEYIDETWKGGYDILPIHPYERAQARFWAHFIDDKIVNALITMIKSEESEKEKASEELKELLKIFQNEVEGKKFLTGNKIGYLDLVAVVVALWVPVILEATNEDIVTWANFPGLCNWADHLLGCDIVKQGIPNREKMLAFYRVQLSALRSKINHT